jgi:adenylate cyclase
VRAVKGVANSNPEGISADLIQAQLERVMASRAFDASHRNRAFLRFVVEETLAGRADRIKAYTIGTGVLERDGAFDPQEDPIVRIEASRLRRSLERYYLLAGQDDPIRIDIPKWSYVPSFQCRRGAADDGTPSQGVMSEGGPPTPGSLREPRKGRGDALAFLTPRQLRAWSGWTAVPLAVVVLAAAIGIWTWHASSQPEGVDAQPVSRGPSIIVLPFENLSGEPAKAYLAGGITEEILTSLAQFEELFVYARETGAHYGSAASYQELHRELGVRYVLDGSVREADGRIRVTARLSDTTTGVQLWASAYEAVGSGAELFQVQNDIARRVVVEVAQPYGVIATADTQLMRGKAPASLSAYECVLQVLDYYRRMSAERVEAARSCLERATESDPEYADAWALLGMSYLDQVRLRLLPRSHDQDLLDRALRAAQRAGDIAPDSALAHRSLLLVHSFRGEVEEALAAGERAVALSPNNAEILAEFGMRLALMGQWERGISLIDGAIAHNPAHPGWYHTAPALNFYRQGRYAEALEEARQIAAPGWVHHHTILAMIYGQLGQEEEARVAARQLLELDPDFEENAWYELQLRNFPDQIAEHMAEGLRKAGLQIPARPPPANETKKPRRATPAPDPRRAAAARLRSACAWPTSAGRRKGWPVAATAPPGHRLLPSVSHVYLLALLL